jgi:transcriptional regulator with XRE-family HTH domain
MDDYKTIGARIRQARIAMGLTQVELAAAVGVSRAHLTNVEGGNGGLALDKLSVLAIETGATVAWLIGEAGPVDQAEVALLTAYKALDQRDRETLLRVAQSFNRDEPPAAPSPRPKEPRQAPFSDGRRRQRKPS